MLEVKGQVNSGSSDEVTSGSERAEFPSCGRRNFSKVVSRIISLLRIYRHSYRLGDANNSRTAPKSIVSQVELWMIDLLVLTTITIVRDSFVFLTVCLLGF